MTRTGAAPRSESDRDFPLARVVGAHNARRVGGTSAGVARSPSGMGMLGGPLQARDADHLKVGRRHGAAWACRLSRCPSSPRRRRLRRALRVDSNCRRTNTGCHAAPRRSGRWARPFGFSPSPVTERINMIHGVAVVLADAPERVTGAIEVPGTISTSNVDAPEGLPEHQAFCIGSGWCGRGGLDVLPLARADGARSGSRGANIRRMSRQA